MQYLVYVLPYCPWYTKLITQERTENDGNCIHINLASKRPSPPCLWLANRGSWLDERNSYFIISLLVFTQKVQWKNYTQVTRASESLPFPHSSVCTRLVILRTSQASSSYLYHCSIYQASLTPPSTHWKLVWAGLAGHDSVNGIYSTFPAPYSRGEAASAAYCWHYNRFEGGDLGIVLCMLAWGDSLCSSSWMPITVGVLWCLSWSLFWNLFDVYLGWWIIINWGYACGCMCVYV